MTKVHKISDIRPTLPLTEFDFFSKYQEAFAKSDLGCLREQLPLKQLAAEFESRLPKRKSQGRKHIFPPEGEIALMFLKSYYSLSDDMLVEQLNGNIFMQLFCGIYIDPACPLRNGKIVSAIRNRLGSVIDSGTIEEQLAQPKNEQESAQSDNATAQQQPKTENPGIKRLQQILYDHWGQHLHNQDMLLVDATCYESLLRFPTDGKLLWESCSWVHEKLKDHCKLANICQPRNKFNDINKARLSLAKKRKGNGSKEAQKLRRRMIQLLDKLLFQWDELSAEHADAFKISLLEAGRFKSISQALCQQKQLLNGEKVENRIVSIDRPYIRPIVRGKENKKVEFGAKSNNISIDGLSFIEYIDFNAFHEGNRLQKSIAYQEQLTGQRVRRLAADAIYATNANRRYCSQHQIVTGFVGKGAKPKDEPSELRRERKQLNKLRATIVEGSFGNQKQHYNLSRVAARNKGSELLQIFFGIHMSNAVIMAQRKLAKEIEQEKRQNQRA